MDITTARLYVALYDATDPNSLKGQSTQIKELLELLNLKELETDNVLIQALAEINELLTLEGY
jgi:hypothetical protein|tara:strand:- start:15453 stop:15641 length:189 start_codon:yes stop_codon:yes gene_type:complete